MAGIKKGQIPSYKNPLYNIWCMMRQRCNNPNSRFYKDYGGRGIKVCNRWNDFSNFSNDMLPSHQLGLSLERINNNAGYSPKNCRWATKKEQANNRRTSRVFTINGISMTFSEWAEHYNIKYVNARQRFYAYGWSIEESLGIVPNKNYRRKHRERSKQWLQMAK